MRQQRRFRVLDGGIEDSPKEDWMERALKVAFATKDLAHVDQHFGSAESLAVYALTPDDCALEEVIQFGSLAQDGNEDKLASKLETLSGCAAVYAQAIGSSAIAQLRALNVQPMKVEPGTPIKVLLGEIQGELKAGPSAWIARALTQQTKNVGRFDDMEAEGWDE